MSNSISQRNGHPFLHVLGRTLKRQREVRVWKGYFCENDESE